MLTCRDVGEVAHDGGHTVPGVHVEHVSLLQAPLIHHYLKELHYE